MARQFYIKAKKPLAECKKYEYKVHNGKYTDRDGIQRDVEPETILNGYIHVDKSGQYAVHTYFDKHMNEVKTIDFGKNPGRAVSPFRVKRVVLGKIDWYAHGRKDCRVEVDFGYRRRKDGSYYYSQGVTIYGVNGKNVLCTQDIKGLVYEHPTFHLCTLLDILLVIDLQEDARSLCYGWLLSDKTKILIEQAFGLLLMGGYRYETDNEPIG